MRTPARGCVRPSCPGRSRDAHFGASQPRVPRSNCAMLFQKTCVPADGRRSRRARALRRRRIGARSPARRTSAVRPALPRRPVREHVPLRRWRQPQHRLGHQSRPRCRRPGLRRSPAPTRPARPARTSSRVPDVHTLRSCQQRRRAVAAARANARRTRRCASSREPRRRGVHQRRRGSGVSQRCRPMRAASRGPVAAARSAAASGARAMSLPCASSRATCSNPPSPGSHCSVAPKRWWQPPPCSASSCSFDGNGARASADVRAPRAVRACAHRRRDIRWRAHPGPAHRANRSAAAP